MTSFDDLQTASRLRDLVVKIATKVVQRERPDVRIGMVYEYSANRAGILFPGESEDNLVRVHAASNMQPTKTVMSTSREEADIVRVAGKPGSYYITDFVRGVPKSTDSIPVFDMDFNGQRATNVGNPVDPGDALNLSTGDTRYATSASVSSKANDAEVVKLTGAQVVAGAKTFASPIRLSQASSTPSAPPASQTQVYFKSDNRPYFMGPDGIERPFIEQPTSLHTNASMESWTGTKPTGWYSYWRDVATSPAAWSQNFVDKWAGDFSFQIDMAASGSTGRIMTTAFGVAVGATVTFSFYAKNLTPTQNARIAVGLMTRKDADPDLFAAGLSTQTIQVPLTSTWDKYTVTWVMPGDHNRVRIDLSPNAVSATAPYSVLLDETFSSATAPVPGTLLSGTIIEYGPTAVPTGYLACDGSTKNIADYPVLAAAVGTKYGGNGTTTFGLPNKAASAVGQYLIKT